MIDTLYERLFALREQLERGVHFVVLPASLLFHAAVDFAWRWCLTRPMRLVWPALPAIVAAAVPLGFLIASQQVDRSQLIVAYNEEVLEAFEEGEYETAELYLRKMTYLDDANPRVQYALATAAERRGDLPRARDLMRRLAPEDGKGHPDAHFWLAKDITRDTNQLGPEQAAVLQHHLEQTLAQQPANQEALVTLAALHRARGDFDQAIPLFKKAARNQPVRLLAVAQLHAMSGNVQKAKAEAGAAASQFKRLSESEPDNLQHRLAWASAERFQENFSEAIRILQESGRTNEGPVRAALANVYLSWYIHLTRTDRDNVSGRLELLQQALTFEPGNQDALIGLASFAAAENSEAATEQLKLALARGTAPATVHYILGTAAAAKGDHAEAARHLELAFAASPQMPAIANNLAWTLAHREPPDLERAEQLIESAAKFAPQHPEIRETRGVIRSKLNKPTEAIADLEFALRAFPQRTRLHNLLAGLYDEIGDAQLADTHRKLAASTEGDNKVDDQ